MPYYTDNHPKKENPDVAARISQLY